MPKKGQTRDLPTDLRSVLAENINELSTRSRMGNAELEKASGVGKATIKRVRAARVAANLDTIQAVASAFDIQPWLLLMPGGAVSMRRVFTTPVPDARLGTNWTRPDRRPLLQSDSAKSSTRKTKIKVR